MEPLISPLGRHLFVDGEQVLFEQSDTIADNPAIRLNLFLSRTLSSRCPLFASAGATTYWSTGEASIGIGPVQPGFWRGRCGRVERKCPR